ncbi:hypothetical protein [Gallibacterium salpingitidis]|uniref:Transferrin-binding protein B C-lobe/N-lobe beta barrel domain-containing protein n=1 Tax=Gallibacterium salpingitidis TaxID=505341 RepID=A0A1A7NP21_9PAST|nr:hypothetical protein [Gallibacterium salpingitidis]OBW90809.1 hypothetical protein QS62_11435 [Gallibacterium salpingitidis]
MKFFKLMMLAVAITFNLVACGSGGSGGGSTTTTTTTETPSTGIKVNKIAALADDAKQGISKQAQQQAQQQNQQQTNEVEHSLNNDGSISYADYGYIEKTVNNQKAYEYFYNVKDDVILKDLGSKLISATYKGNAYMRDLGSPNQMQGTLSLHIEENMVSGVIDFGGDNFINLDKTSLTNEGYKGTIITKEDGELGKTSGTYQGILVGGETKTDMTFGKFEVEKDGKKVADGLFNGTVYVPSEPR